MSQDWTPGFNEASEMQSSRDITVEEFARLLNLKILSSNDSKASFTLSSFSVNRPGLLLKGFTDYFANSRIQVIGHAETYYLMTLSESQESVIIDKFFSTNVPCVILARGISPSKIFLKCAKKYNTPIFTSIKVTSDLVNELVNFLAEYLAKRDIIQGELLDVGGVGVLIEGASGLGKSETALDLITRGHKLVADDVVEISNHKGILVGTAPSKIRYYMEIRGIGIIDVRKLYGVASVLESKEINFIVEFTKWTKDIDVDRLGDTKSYKKILGIDVRKLTIPVAAGRNLANIIEVASRNYRCEQFGYSTLDEFLSDKI